jgi:ABC-type enterochelin transport system substrate-binding protein
MNKNCLKYLQDIKYLQVGLAEKTEIQNLCRAKPDLIINYHRAENKYMWENLTLLYTLTKSGWVAVLKESLY